MPARPLRRGAAVLGLATALAAGVGLAATPGIAPAEVAVQADRTAVGFGDIAVVYQVGRVDAATVAASEQVASATGGWSTVGGTGTLHVRRIARPGATVYAPPDGYTFPMTFAAFAPETLGWLLGFGVAGDASAATHPAGVVLNAASAALSGAQAGDTIEVETRAGGRASLTVTAVVPREHLGSTEVVMTTDLAERLGETRQTRTIVWGFDSRAAVDAAFATTGLDRRRDIDIARSWDAPDPDSTLSTLDIKRLLGTPWYLVGDGGNSVSMHPAWREANLTPTRVLLNEQIPVRARCHLKILADLRAAFADVAAAGLGGAIDVGNANTYGGCYTPRFARESWNLSRHSYGLAFDTNTVDNCQGCVPAMDCDVVRIFRRHHFAWGGNFSRPDGMHFEWVGEARDQLAYPSTYCRNTPATAAQLDPQADPPPPATIGRAALDLRLPD
ncbi:MAG TPA: M15 family metallopeptidase [Ilumatobacter sp.]|nr:M15 family metallopeptidase [Ilumatobacter sp.]